MGKILSDKKVIVEEIPYRDIAFGEVFKRNGNLHVKGNHMSDSGWYYCIGLEGGDLGVTFDFKGDTSVQPANNIIITEAGE